MIHGVVNDRLEATLILPIEDSLGQLHPTLVTVDTAFNRELALPGYLISRLGLTFSHQERLRLGNGTIEWVDLFEALVVWDSNTIQVRVLQVETDPLIGTQLLDGYEVKIQFRDGGSVVIEGLP